MQSAGRPHLGAPIAHAHKRGGRDKRRSDASERASERVGATRTGSPAYTVKLTEYEPLFDRRGGPIGEREKPDADLSV